MSCFCNRCNSVRSLGLDPDDAFEMERGGSMVAAYVRRHGTSIPQAVEALSVQMQDLMAATVEVYGRRHGLDEGDTWAALLTYGIDGPRWLQ